MNMTNETQNLLSLQLVSFLVGLRTYHHSLCICYIYSTNIPAIMIINRIHETQNLVAAACFHTGRAKDLSAPL